MLLIIFLVISLHTQNLKLCDGFHVGRPAQYKPENGHHYKVVAPGGPENTTPLFENGKCWPSHICE